jgi:ankyrin repeat protein
MFRKVLLSFLAIACVFVFASDSFGKIDGGGGSGHGMWGSDFEDDFIRLCPYATPEEIKLAIRGGANVNAKEDDGLTALMAAAYKNEYPEVISLLLKAGADVSAKEDDGLTALMRAASNKNPKITSLLLEAGADVNAKDNDGNTALMIASEYGDAAVVSQLLKAGAEVNAKNNDGYTALMRASKSSDRDIVSLLLKVGADVNAKSNEGYTSLMEVSKYDNLRDFLTSLLEADSIVNTMAEVIKILADAGADVNVKNSLGRTALGVLIEEESVNFTVFKRCRLIKTFLEIGVDPNILDNAGKKAFDYMPEPGSGYSPYTTSKKYVVEYLRLKEASK